MTHSRQQTTAMEGTPPTSTGDRQTSTMNAKLVFSVDQGVHWQITGLELSSATVCCHSTSSIG